MGKYDAAGRGSYGRGGGSGGSGASTVLLAVIGLIVLGALGFFGYRYAQSRSAREVDRDNCLTNATGPQASLFLIDETDRLSHENAERIKARIRDGVNTMPRYSRVIIVPFGGDIATPLQPIFNKCLPGRSSTASLDEGAQLLDEQYQAFEKTLDAEVRKLEELPDSKTSPITDQVIRAASDPELHWQGKARTLVLITDGLESSIYWTRNLHLKDAPEGLLRGVHAEFFEIGNARATRLQTPSMRSEWKRWLEKAGADVRVTAPGYSAADG
jgi:hypothetical protein